MNRPAVAVLEEEERLAHGAFQAGKYDVQSLTIPSPSACSKRDQNGVPKPLVVAVPKEKGRYPVFLFLHGYLLENSFYSELLAHVASHGYIAIAPQMYRYAWIDASGEIRDTENMVEWMKGSGLDEELREMDVCGDYERLSIGGHSRGGSVAFSVAERGNVKVSCVVGLDPVDNGMILKGKGHEEWMLEGVGKMVVGMGLGELKANALFPPCAPKDRNQRVFWKECCGPLFQLVAKEYGHMDILDDETSGVRGNVSNCVCKKGPSRALGRCFAGGCVVSFLAWFLREDKRALRYMMSHPSVFPVEVETPQCRGVRLDDGNEIALNQTCSTIDAL